MVIATGAFGFNSPQMGVPAALYSVSMYLFVSLLFLAFRVSDKLKRWRLLPSWVICEKRCLLPVIWLRRASPGVLAFPDCSALWSVPTHGTTCSVNLVGKPCRSPSALRLRMQRVEIPAGTAPKLLETGCRSWFYLTWKHETYRWTHPHRRFSKADFTAKYVQSTHGNIDLISYNRIHNLHFKRMAVIDNPQWISSGNW